MFEKQTELGEYGNCMSACLAALFKIPLATVPNFNRLAHETTAQKGGDVGRNFYILLEEWLKLRGVGVITLDAAHFNKWVGTQIVSGYTDRSDSVLHAVLYKDGKLFFDPHPSNRGILEPLEVDILYSLNL